MVAAEAAREGQEGTAMEREEEEEEEEDSSQHDAVGGNR